jgi:RNA polymerase sigma factor (sigma-70 family)
VDTANFLGEEPSPSEIACGVEEVLRVRRTLAELREDDREILRLTFEERLTLREAAARMGRSREATKKLYARALRRFKEALEKGKGGGDAT